MDNFNDIIFFGAIIIAVITNVVKVLKKKDESQKKPVFQEVFTDYRELEEEKQEEKVVTEKKEVVLNQVSEEIPKPIQKTIANKTDAEENQFNLADASEARKAFIYSEIFNKKY